MRELSKEEMKVVSGGSPTLALPPPSVEKFLADLRALLEPKKVMPVSAD